MRRLFFVVCKTIPLWRLQANVTTINAVLSCFANVEGLKNRIECGFCKEHFAPFYSATKYGRNGMHVWRVLRLVMEQFTASEHTNKAKSEKHCCNVLLFQTSRNLSGSR